MMRRIRSSRFAIRNACVHNRWGDTRTNVMVNQLSNFIAPTHRTVLFFSHHTNEEFVPTTSTKIGFEMCMNRGAVAVKPYNIDIAISVPRATLSLPPIRFVRNGMNAKVYRQRRELVNMRN